MSKRVKGLDRKEYMSLCEEVNRLVSGRKVKSCTQRWRKKLDP